MDMNFVIGMSVGAAVAIAFFILSGKQNKEATSPSEWEVNSWLEHISTLQKKVNFLMDLNLIHQGIDPSDQRPLQVDKNVAIRRLVSSECNRMYYK